MVMNLIAKLEVCDVADLVVMDFETVPAFPCGHPRISENVYVYAARDGKVYKYCKRCRANRQLRWWRRRHDLHR